MYKLNNISTPKKLLETVNDLGVRSNPNILINGDFAINQRGQSSYTTHSTYTVDRWNLAFGSLVVNADKTVSHTASNTFQGIRQFIEMPSRYAGKTVTISANGKATSGSFLIDLRYRLSGSGTSVSIISVSSTATSFTTIKATATIPSTLTDADSLFVILYTAAAGATITWAWAKLELGSIATPFVPPLIADELLRCRMYYQKIISTGEAANTLGYGVLRTSTESRFNIPLSATLRTTPTIANNGLEVFNFVTGTEFTPNGTVTIGSINSNSVFVHITHSESMGARSAFMQTYGATGTGFISFDAEVY